MKLRTHPDGLIAHDHARDRWVRLPGEDDLLAVPRRGRSLLASGPRPRSPPTTPSRPTPTAGPAVPAALDARVHALGVARRSPRAGCWSSASSRRRRRRPSPASSGSPAGPFPKLKPNERFHETPTFYVANHTAVLADGEDMWWPRTRKYLDFELELAFVLRQAARRRDARGGGATRSAAGSSSTTGAPATCRPRTLRAQHLRPGDQVEDLRQLDRLRRAHRRRAARLDRRRPAGSGSTASSGARARPPGPPHDARRDARLRLGRRAARRRRRDLDRDDARLLRARARPLDPAGPDRRARDRRHRHAHQPDQPTSARPVCP